MSIAQSPPPTNSPPALACRRCGSLGPHQRGPGAGPHYARLICDACGAFVCWLSRYTPQEQAAHREQARQAAMGQRPPSVRQLDLLSDLGYAGSAPASMRSASVIISGLLVQRRQEGRV